jgi:hypothetical protein
MYFLHRFSQQNICITLTLSLYSSITCRNCDRFTFLTAMSGNLEPGGATSSIFPVTAITTFREYSIPFATSIRVAITRVNNLE